MTLTLPTQYNDFMGYLNVGACSECVAILRLAETTVAARVPRTAAAATAAAAAAAAAGQWQQQQQEQDDGQNVPYVSWMAEEQQNQLVLTRVLTSQ
jgi:hypothetical protein